MTSPAGAVADRLHTQHLAGPQHRNCSNAMVPWWLVRGDGGSQTGREDSMVQMRESNSSAVKPAASPRRRDRLRLVMASTASPFLSWPLETYSQRRNMKHIRWFGSSTGKPHPVRPTLFVCRAAFVHLSCAWHSMQSSKTVHQHLLICIMFHPDPRSRRWSHHWHLAARGDSYQGKGKWDW